MPTTSEFPDIPDMVDPDRVAKLLDAQVAILDLAKGTEDPALAIHISGVRFAGELYFAAEALHEQAESLNQHNLAAGHARSAAAARQLLAHHLDTLDRHLDLYIK